MSKENETTEKHKTISQTPKDSFERDETSKLDHHETQQVKRETSEMGEQIDTRTTRYTEHAISVKSRRKQCQVGGCKGTSEE